MNTHTIYLLLVGLLLSPFAVSDDGEIKSEIHSKDKDIFKVISDRYKQKIEDGELKTNTSSKTPIHDENYDGKFLYHKETKEKLKELEESGDL